MLHGFEAWRRDHVLWVEIFAVLNLAFLALDISLAHSVNSFRHPAEYIPLVFSIAAPPVMVAGIFARARGKTALWRWLGHLLGWSSLAIGLAGVLFHLESAFFLQRTVKSLTYAAPFAAPLAYAGLGLLLIMNRMVASATERVGSMGAAAGAGRLCWQLCPEPDRPRGQWLFPLHGMDSGNCQRSGRGISVRTVSRAGKSRLSRNLRVRNGRTGLSRPARLRISSRGKSQRPFRQHAAKFH